MKFNDAFKALTGHSQFPWQVELFKKFARGEIPPSCNLPTGLGKTNVITIWLIALAHGEGKLPRRLVYVVNRRTVVDQATHEAERLRENIQKPELADLAGRLRQLCATRTDDDKAPPLAISTLRGQFADNGEWCADPARPAIIIGTVDMIGSRLLFSGYGIGFKRKPLHAGFLGQDALLVHDEAHLEQPFQDLLVAIRKEQELCKEFGTFRVLELSATSRGQDEPFELTTEERNPPHVIPDPPMEPIHFVWRRLTARKAMVLHPIDDEKNELANTIAEFALKHKGSGRAVLVFARTVENVEKIADRLRKAKQQVETLTGTMRGLERDGLVRKPIFQRFLPDSNRGKDVTPVNGAVYLVCTSAGEVGIDISADHLVCDLTPFDSMAQRFGRVNRFGARDDTRIDVAHAVEFDDRKEFDRRRKLTLELLKKLDGNGSPAALGKLSTSETLAAFTPTPVILPTTDILFDSWAMTTIRGKLPGRPPVDPYLHGIRDWESPETYVAWREEVGIITGHLLERYKPEDLLDDYPLKPHELLRDSTFRKNSGIRDKLTRLAETNGKLPVWVQESDGSVIPTTLSEVPNLPLVGRTVILPPKAGGLMISEGRSKGLFDGVTEYQPECHDLYDVGDTWTDEKDRQRRVRVWDDDPQFAEKTKRMRPIRKIRFQTDEENEDAPDRFWLWFERPGAADNEGSKFAQKPVLWQVHTDDAANNADVIVEKLPLADDVKKAVILAARFHDLGKRRPLFQRILGNFNSHILLAKSGKKGSPIPEHYRHEFGSLLEAQEEPEFQKQSHDVKNLILHLIATSHGRGRPHFPADEAFDPEPKGKDVSKIAVEVAQRFARLQRKYGRWGLAYIESLLRAADYAASANPSAFMEREQENQL